MNEAPANPATQALFRPPSAEFMRDPYPFHERLRSSDPMHLTPFGRCLASRHATASIVLRASKPKS